MPKENLDEIISVFFDPLEKIVLSGMDKMAQIAATVVLSDLVEHLGLDGNYKYLLTSLNDKIFRIVTKSKCDSPQVFDSIFNLIKSISFEEVFDNLPDIYEKTVSVLNTNVHYLVNNP